jgi:outer membrane lipoprotein SlyB
LSFDSLRMSDGRRVDIRARVVSLEEEGLDKSKAGLGALIGGILGAVVDGKQGAVIGGILGGGGTVVASTGDDVELPAGTILTIRLDRPAMVALR